LASPLPVYCDLSLQPFDLVYPAAGSLNSSVRVTPARLAELVSSGWVDVCRVPDDGPRLGAALDTRGAPL
jgi:prolyl-tRNA editing enzyme YbaK/EbsC (Cys-tRNA(Pro) deacylase)